MPEMTKFKADMLRWTTPEGQKLFCSLEIFDMLYYFFRMPKVQRLPFLAYMASCFMDCRCCIILQKNGKKHDEKKLFLTAGYPTEESAHGFGTEIIPATGKDFLTKIIKEGNIVIIHDSPNDPRVAYMKDMIFQHGIKSQLFLTLYLKKLAQGFEIDPFGVLVFDSTKKNGETFKGSIATAKKIARVVVALIINEERNQQMDYELARMACANALSEHSKGFEDEFRNTPTTLGANATKIMKILEKMSDDSPENEKIKKALGYAKEVVEITSEFSKKANDFLSAIKIRLSNLTVQEHDLKEFAKFVAREFVRDKNLQQQEICVNVEISKLAKNKKARFDWKKMLKCLHAIMDNAVKYEASTIWLKISIKHGEPNKPIVMITVINNGTPMSQSTADQLLQYFSSTDRKTASGGLSTANAIIQAHGGKLEPKIKPRTQFIIQLPTI
jgi:signal transduction histidine kinase